MGFMSRSKELGAIPTTLLKAFTTLVRTDKHASPVPIQRIYAPENRILLRTPHEHRYSEYLHSKQLSSLPPYSC